jgi:multicomponent K+:H+ antiporter subunit E
MKRWLPYPLLSALLFTMWLALNQTLQAGQMLIGATLALAGGLALARLQVPRSEERLHVLQRGAAALQLAWLVFTDIVRSNLAVARVVVNPNAASVKSGFVSIPLHLRDPGGLAALACIITATPGTSWARYDAAGGILTIHVLDLVDEGAWIVTIQQRYERRLREIFE